MTEIRLGDVERSLEIVRARCRSILDPGAQRVLYEAKSRLRQSNAEYNESKRQQRRARQVRPWGFSIPPTDPLQFNETIVDGFRMKVDLFLRAFWDTEPADQPHELTVTMRVWCLDPSVFFRGQWDAPALEGGIDPDIGRVMLRIHFDLANPGQSGPRYHLQFGGVQHPGELHWFPESLSVPRLPHMPLDLTLAVEMIAKTFHSEKYERLRGEPTWKSSRKTSERHLLSDYLAQAIDAIRTGDSVLETLWNG